MTDQPQEIVEVTPETPEAHDEYDGYHPPTGAFIFVLVLLAAYGIYWVLTYYEIVVLRAP